MDYHHSRIIFLDTLYVLGSLQYYHPGMEECWRGELTSLTEGAVSKINNMNIRLGQSLYYTCKHGSNILFSDKI